jgi:hypothetical protein
MNESFAAHPPAGAHRWLMLAAAAAGSVILVRASLDVSLVDRVLPFPVGLFFLGTLALIVTNLLTGFRAPGSEVQISSWTHLALVLAIPVGFVAAALDCTGADLGGCTPVCAFLIRAWSPLVAVAALTFLVTGRRWLLPLMAALCFVYLAPSCRCYNPLSAWWIDHFSVNPACFGAGFWVSVIAITALSWGKLTRISAVACWLMNTVLLGFFVGHHYYHCPW